MKRTKMLFFFLLIASSFYYSDAKKMHRSRVRQEWDFQCAKGESISGLTAQHVIDDVVVTFACDSLSDSSDSPTIEEGACRETKEFQVFKDGKLAPEGGESGCKSDEYVAGVKSSVFGKAATFERKLIFKCCKAKNAKVDDSDCHFVGPTHPFHFKKGKIVNLINTAKPGQSCPKYGLSTFLVDQTGFTLKYCLWKVKGVNYPEKCSKVSSESTATEKSKDRTPNEAAHGQEKITLKGAAVHDASEPDDKIKPPSAVPPSSSSAEGRRKNPVVRAESKHSGLSGHTQAAEPEVRTNHSPATKADDTTKKRLDNDHKETTTLATSKQQSTTKSQAASVGRGRRISQNGKSETHKATHEATAKPTHSSRSKTTTKIHKTQTEVSFHSSTKMETTHTENKAPLTADELSEIVDDPKLVPEIEGEAPKPAKNNESSNKKVVIAEQRDHPTTRSVPPATTATTKPKRKLAVTESNTHKVKEQSTEHRHVPSSLPKKEKTVNPPQTDRPAEVLISSSLDAADHPTEVVISSSLDAADQPRIHVHEDTIAIPKDIVAEKAVKPAAHPASSTSSALKCKPGSVGNQKWNCFAGEHCSSDETCATKCNSWKPGLDFGTVAASKCVAGDGNDQYCCCTYEGQGQSDCPSANDHHGSVSGGGRRKIG